jgi:hypothetical protein
MDKFKWLEYIYFFKEELVLISKEPVSVCIYYSSHTLNLDQILHLIFHSQHLQLVKK